MIKLSSSDLLRGIVGESEARVRQITSLIEALAPVTVGVDEIDALAPARGKVMMTDSGVNRRVTNMLLEWLGNRRRKSFLIGATNFLEDIDFAFLRAGRFDEICLIIPPDATARKQILTLHSSVIRKLPLTPKLDLTEIAGQPTFMWTPAELEKLCLDAARTGMEQDAKKITLTHFRDALNNIKINVKERQTKIQTGVAKMKELDIVNKGFLDAQLKVFEKGEGDKDRVRAFIDNL